jgi:hypothetical protein
MVGEGEIDGDRWYAEDGEIATRPLSDEGDNAGR